MSAHHRHHKDDDDDNDDAADDDDKLTPEKVDITSLGADHDDRETRLLTIERHALVEQYEEGRDRREITCSTELTGLEEYWHGTRDTDTDTDTEAALEDTKA